VAVLSQILKHSGREEQAFLLSLAGLAILKIIVTLIHSRFPSYAFTPEE